MASSFGAYPPPYLLLCTVFYLSFTLICDCTSMSEASDNITLDSLRDSLEKQEDFIVFSLIERARYPLDSPAYGHSSCPGRQSCSFAELFVRTTEEIEAKFGRYQNPEEVPFFSNYLPSSPPGLIPSFKFPQVLYPKAASVNVSRTIWEVYFNDLLPQFTTKGDDGNYQQAVASDLICLQALSKRIHLGRFVAEVKYRSSPQDYNPSIRSKDLKTLTELVTSEQVEAMVVKRVKKKAEVFGQDVTLDSNGNQTTYKVDPLFVSNLYKKWVIPLTKQVEVNYLLRRLG
ncbi:hypothetical protein HPP92_017170 [Vanilla planifolia]|uniref:Chorismate mutase n=1 Tax=Vanilla planifolia TaxID=51239 RepID=A0A835URZ2_VANPL|nr:hypothetical protein HPP92_017170 [Vanilla planifolia]